MLEPEDVVDGTNVNTLGAENGFNADGGGHADIKYPTLFRDSNGSFLSSDTQHLGLNNEDQWDDYLLNSPTFDPTT
jgi:hypothetical protein